MPSPTPPAETRDWIETLVGLAARLGLNPTRVRWKLLRWQKSWQQTGRQAEQQVRHIRYEHQVCHHCGGLQDGSARLCTLCGARLSSRGWVFLERLGLAMPRMLSVSTLLGVAIVVVYFRLMAARWGGGILSVDGDILVRFGANVPLAILDGEVWRLATAMFLHIGLWHLAFNLLALAQIGPQIEEVFGRARMLFYFFLTGVVANLGSMMLGDYTIQAGASGALMGLIGLAAGWGQRQGTTLGRELRNRMLTWCGYTLLFGWFIHADNWAHGLGFLTGGVLGYLTPARWLRRTGRTEIALGVVGTLLAVFTVAAVLLPVPSPWSQRFAEAFSAEPGGPAGSARTVSLLVQTCQLHSAGKTEEARELYTRMTDGQFSPEQTAQMIQGLCGNLRAQADHCRAQLEGRALPHGPGQEEEGPISDEECRQFLEFLEATPEPR